MNLTSRHFLNRLSITPQNKALYTYILKIYYSAFFDGRHFKNDPSMASTFDIGGGPRSKKTWSLTVLVGGGGGG